MVRMKRRIFLTGLRRIGSVQESRFGIMPLPNPGDLPTGLNAVGKR